MKRIVEYFKAEQRDFAYEVNYYAKQNNLQIVSITIADAFTDGYGAEIVFAYVIFEEEQK